MSGAAGPGRWQFWIDRGGTFTDCLGRNPKSGRIRTAKVPSSDRAPLIGIRWLLGIGEEEPIPPSEVRLGTTLATNALLERRGVPTALVITRGFRDLLEIGTQERPSLFDLRIARPERLYSRVIETEARVDATGGVLARVDRAALGAALEGLRREGIPSLAVVVLHSYRAPGLELEIGALAREVGFRQVSLSHEVASELGLLARGETAVVDAYLTPLLRRYLSELGRELPGSTLRLMQSSGGLTDAAGFRGRNAVLSGPAAGAVACAHVARASGAPRVVGFDMGGTSTDVSCFEGGLERVHETEIAGVRLRAPMMAIHTVAAGGGSLCRYRGGRLTVGPESAGAEPGPLCYGRPEARELALTDIDLLLGRLVPDRFPFPLDRERAAAALDALAAEVASDGVARRAEDLALGFVAIAESAMAEAVRRITLGRGRDPRDYDLLVFGGAGGQHACGVARRLGIRRILLHRFGGVLSAWGMGLARESWHGELDAGRRRLAPGLLAALEPVFAALERRGREALLRAGVQPARAKPRRWLELRYRGAEATLAVASSGDEASLRTAFETAHRERFGYARPRAEVEAVTGRVEVVAAAGAQPPSAPERLGPVTGRAAGPRSTRLFSEGAWREVPLLVREEISPGTRLRGPTLVLDPTATILVESGFELEVTDADLLVLRDRSPAGAGLRAPARADRADPAELEIFNHLFMSIAEQMGAVLERSAFSTNIRDRRDFSCAVFDASGGLVANAPHIPVHLGAMGESVRELIERWPAMKPGDVFATNDPAAGGSHLPDVTVVTPVFDDRGERLFFTASRGHHADVGGSTPGSMPAFSSRLADEGVVLRGLRIVRRGRFAGREVRSALASGPHPARDPAQNLADLEAQIAANRQGARLLQDAARRHGLDRLLAYMQHVQENAASHVRSEIARLPDGLHRFADALDDGTPIRVTVRVAGDRMDIDFTGTGPAVHANRNAPRAVTIAAVLYVLRALVAAPIPLNRGCLEPVAIRIPRGSVLDPPPEAAVCGGNVETSQRVVDVLLGALGRAAASQGTMNNLSLGDEDFAYYETIAGGAGAGPGFHGASGVHTHMTNTRITDPEVLEARYPLRLIQFSLRRGSGGSGRWRGGDGVVREIELLRPLRVSLLSERRVLAPFGLAGGAPGARGRNLLDGRPLPGTAAFDAPAGSRLRIETPGGGGWGDALAGPAAAR